MTYSTKTRSNTPPGRYHVRQTLSHWKTDRKQEDRRQKTEAKPCYALSSSQMTPAHAVGGVNHMPIPMLSSRLCCRLPLSWLPVNRSSEGDTQSCCIVIGIALKNCIEGTAPTSWSIVDSRTQPLGPNHGLCCRCRCRSRNWRRFSAAMFTSARQTKRKIVISLLNARLIAGCTVADARVVEYVSSMCRCQCRCRNWHNLLYGGASKLETHLRGDVNFRSTNEVEVLIIAGSSVADARVVEYVLVSVSKMETLLHSCNSNWRRFSVGRSSSASPRKLIPVDRGSPYSASRVEEGLSSLKV